MLIYQKPTMWDKWEGRGTITCGPTTKPKDKEKEKEKEYFSEEEFKV